MWMYKDGITRWVPENEVQDFNNLGYQEVKETGAKDEEKTSKISKNGGNAESKADKL